MKRDLLRSMLEARAAKRPLVLVTELVSGDQWLLGEGGAASELDSRAWDAAQDALRQDRSTAVEFDGTRYFLHVMSPPLRMFVVGAVHIAQALAPMASLVGYDVTVIDPRRAFASSDRFPAVNIATDWPDEVLAGVALDRRSAVVTLTHDPKIDDPALRVALDAPVFYIGCLGSRRTHAKRVERLAAAGFSDEAIARIRAPVGLDIGAISAPEIAASIVAEVTACFRGRLPE